MNKQDKELLVKELQDKFSTAKSIIFADFKGLNVEHVTVLRRRMREESVEYRVVKNSLIKKALGGLEEVDPFLVGSTAVAISYDNPALPAKLLTDFAKEFPDMLRVKAGVLGKDLYDLDQVTALASLPSRDELIAKILGLLQAPMTGLVGVLQGPTRQLAVVLSAVADQQQAS